MNIDDGGLSVEMTGSRFYANPNWAVEEAHLISMQKVKQFQYLSDGTLVILLSNGIAYTRENGSYRRWKRQDWVKELAQSVREYGVL